MILDFGGVVVEWNMRALFVEFFDDPADLDAFLSDVLTPAENLRCDLGTPLAAVVGGLGRTAQRQGRHQGQGEGRTAQKG